LRYFANMILAICVSISGSAALAISDCTQSCQDLALKIPHQLVAKGLNKIGKLDLQALDEKFRQGRVVFIRDDLKDTPMIGSGDALRGSAVFFMESKTTAIMMKDWLETPVDVRPVTMLHEFLNFSGIDDEIYQVSAALNELNSVKDPAELKNILQQQGMMKLLNDLPMRSSAPRYALPGPSGERGKSLNSKDGGGATAVGGGGDSVAIEAKMTLLAIAMQFKDLSEVSRDKLQADILNMSIEAPLGASVSGEFRVGTEVLNFAINRDYWRTQSAAERCNIVYRMMGKILISENFPELQDEQEKN